MSDSRKPTVTVRIYYQFPRKGWETAPNQVTLEQVKKYLSGKPLRFGPERNGGDDVAGESEKTDPRADRGKASDLDAT